MKVLFVSANRERLPYPVPPLGLLYVMSAVDGSRHTKRLLDLCFEDDPVRAVEEEVRDFNPGVVAVGLRNIQNADYTAIEGNLQYYRSLIDTIRTVSSAAVVLGGSGFSVMPRELLEAFEGVDFGIQGEGERAFPRLLAYLDGRDVSLRAIDNLYYREGGRVRETSSRTCFTPMGSLELPDFERIPGRYFAETGLAPIQSQRGCPLRCTYCTYPKIEGRQPRTRDPEAVVDEMFLRADEHPEIEHFFFVDATFNLPIEYAKELCEEMVGRGWEMPWTCYLNPRAFDRELAHLMAEAGCKGVEIGSDSGSARVLEALRKGFRREDITRAHELCEDVDILDCHTFLLAWSGSSLKHVRTTLDFVEGLDPVTAIFMIWKDDYEALKPEVAKQRRRLRDETRTLLERRARENPNWVVPPMGIRFDRDLFEALRNRGRRGPLWQTMEEF